MEMERTRRSLDRARDLASLKKPRLSDDPDRDRDRDHAVIPPPRERALPPRASSASATAPPVDPRFRPAAQRQKDAREDSSRAAAAPYQPQQQQQMQELVAQYKTALSELTFNSKPIITNLTIIAGENLHAAKGITATICAHILEVPSEQKLPSLYLLDSIVKNIGRDYIKYFAARLPEVFCKAYKQVDSSIHPGMRHLFGTWRGVFPPSALQFIEKELFSPVTNSSSSGVTVSETDSQTQRPPHSIHVNPKYLEARQRLHQSTRSAGVSSDNLDGAVNSVEDLNRPGRTSNMESARPWADPSNIQPPLRELIKEPSHKKSSGLGERDCEFTSDISQYPDLKMGRGNTRVTERAGVDSSWYGTGRGGFDTSIDQRNGSDVTPSHGSYKPAGSSQIGQQASVKQSAALKNNHAPSRSWKNSEEEEYMWDDMNSKLTDHAGNDSSVKAGWDPDDTERHVSLSRGKWMDTQLNKFGASPLEKISEGEGRVPTAMEYEENLAPSRYQSDAGLMARRGASSDPLFGGGSLLGSRNLSGRLHQESTNAFGHIDIASRNSGLLGGRQISLSSGLSMTSDLSFTKSGIMGHSGLSVDGVPSNLGTSTSSNSPPCNTFLQHPKSHGLSGQDYHQHHSTPQTSQIPGHFLGQSNQVLSSKIGSDYIPVKSQLPNTIASFQIPSQISQQNETPLPPLAPFSEVQNRLPVVQQSQPDQLYRTEIQSQLSNETRRPSVGVSTQLGSFSMGNNSSAESSGQPSAADLLAAIMKSGLISNNPARNLQSSNVRPPLPSGPPPVQAVIPSTTLVQPSADSEPASTGNNLSLDANPIRAVHPPLPPGPPPPSSLVSQVESMADAKPNPLSSLLNSLVAKGLISSTGTDMLTENLVVIKNEVEVPHQLPNHTTHLSVSASDHSISSLDTSTTPSIGGISLSEPSESKGTTLSEDGAEVLKDLIGFDFKPEVIRTFHPVVISALFDDLKYQCRICRLKFQLQEQLGKHLDSHDSRKSEHYSQDLVSQKWFMNKCDWIAGSIPSESGSIETTLIEGTTRSIEKSEPMVPADESQCLCALCGEPFEDLYCHIRDAWMYKGTVYITASGGKGKAHCIDEDAAPGLIVHDKCLQRSSMAGL